jgi:hypothetical protein
MHVGAGLQVIPKTVDIGLLLLVRWALKGLDRLERKSFYL